MSEFAYNPISKYCFNAEAVSDNTSFQSASAFQESGSSLVPKSVISSHAQSSSSKSKEAVPTSLQSKKIKRMIVLHGYHPPVERYSLKYYIFNNREQLLTI